MSELYFTEPYQKEFITEIVQIIEKNNKYHITLEQTAFFPGSDEMPHDVGFIEDCPITSVYAENNVIYHVSPKKPIKIHKVKCRIDWPRRFHYMQQHLALHLVTACLKEDFNLEVSSSKLRDGMTSLTINGVFHPEQLTSLEQSLNTLISENLPVMTLTPTKQELKKLGYKKPLPKGITPRFIAVDEHLLSLCMSLHLKSTIELQALKFIKLEKNKGTVTLTFLVGQAAITHLLAPAETSAQETDELSSKCQRLMGEVQKYKGLVDDYKAKEAVQSATEVGQLRVIKNIYEDQSLKDLQSFATKMVKYDNVVTLLGLKAEGTSYLLFMCSKELTNLNMNTLLKDSITLIDGQGGGTAFSAQGGGKSVSNLESALDYAFMKLQKSL